MDFLEDEAGELEEWYLSIMVEPYFINFPKLRLDVKINSFMPATFGIKFRFRSQEDMRRILNAWRLPETLYLDDGTVISAEFALLFSIRRLATHTNLEDFTDLEFGRDYSVLSRVFKFFVMYTYHNFNGKLTNNLQFFVNKFPSYAEAIMVQ